MLFRMSAGFLLFYLLSSAPVDAEEMLLRLGANGSTATLNATGSSVTVTVRDVSPQAAQAGVRPGKVLFQGQRSGDALDGVAWDTRPGCPEFTFRMRGSIDATAVTLSGEAPTFIMPGCTPFVTQTERYQWPIVERSQGVPTQPIEGLDLAGSLWRTSGGSIVLLTESGDSLSLTIQEPSSAAFNNGARAGTVIFQLNRSGEDLSGTQFYPFATGCAPAPFLASGRVRGRDQIVLNTRGVTNYEIGSCHVNATAELSTTLQRLPPTARPRPTTSENDKPVEPPASAALRLDKSECEHAEPAACRRVLRSTALSSSEREKFNEILSALADVEPKQTRRQPTTPCFERGEPTKTLADCKKLLEDISKLSGPDLAEVLVNRGDAEARLNNLDDAIASYNRALKLLPANVRALSGRANAYVKQSRKDKALEDLKRLKELAPEDPSISERIANLGN